MIASKTPLRMSFVGGGSDLSSYYQHEGGAVLSTSIDKYIYVIVNRKFDSNIRLSYSVTEEVSSINELKHPIVRNVLELMRIKEGVEISSMADIPSKGSGLGSSSSFTVGLLNALHAYQSKYISKEKLGHLASDIEINFCKEPIGKQDQYAAAFGGLNLIRFHSDETVSVDPIVCPPSTVKTLQENIIVFYTGRTRSASSILKEQSENMGSSRDKRALMKDMVNLVYEMKYLLESNDVGSIGDLLDQNWRLKCQLASGITDTKIDQMYKDGIQAGASGGKLLGAGNGGFLMFYADKHKHPSIIKAMHGLRRLPISFESGGSQIIHYQQSSVDSL